MSIQKAQPLQNSFRRKIVPFPFRSVVIYPPTESRGAEEARTPDLQSAILALSQAELQPHPKLGRLLQKQELFSRELLGTRKNLDQCSGIWKVESKSAKLDWKRLAGLGTPAKPVKHASEGQRRTGRLKAGPSPADTPTRVLACRADHTTTTQGLEQTRARYHALCRRPVNCPERDGPNICKSCAKYAIHVTT